MSAVMTHAPTTTYYTVAAQVIPIFLLALSFERNAYPQLLRDRLDRERIRDIWSWVPNTRLGSARVFVFAGLMTLLLLPVVTVAGALSAYWALAAGRDTRLSFALCNVGLVSGALLVALPLIATAVGLAARLFAALFENDSDRHK